MAKAQNTSKAASAGTKVSDKPANGRVTKSVEAVKVAAKSNAAALKGKMRNSVTASKRDSDSDEDDESEDDSEDDQEESSDSGSSDEEATKADAKPAKAGISEGKVNGVKKAKHGDESSSAEDDEDDEDESADNKAASAVKSKASSKNVTSSAPKKVSKEDDSSDEDDSSSAEEDDDDAKAKPKGAKARAANGVAKVSSVPKKDTSDDEMESGSSDSNESEAGDDSDEGSSGSSDDDKDAKKKPSVVSPAEMKKRKADDVPEPAAKRAKPDGASTNLFVGNLSWNVDEEWLRREFEEFGEVVGCRIMTDRETGRSKGFGYVDFTSGEDASKALKAMHQSMMDGRSLNVDYSTPRDKSDSTKTQKANYRAEKFADTRSAPSDTIFVGNIAFEATADDVQQLFAEYGTITRVSLPTDYGSGAPKGFGYVSFSSVSEAQEALEAVNGTDLAGRPIRLDFAQPRSGGEGGGSRGGRDGGGWRGGRGDSRGGRGGGRGGRGSFGGSPRGSFRGGRGGRGGTTNRGGFGDFSGKKMTF